MLFELRSKKFTVGNLSSSKINKLKMSLFIEHEVLGLGNKFNTLRSLWVMPLEWRY